ncbi:unnamed protein product, partial [Linum tenue]
ATLLIFLPVLLPLISSLKGYSGWEKFFLREVEDKGTIANQYKSEKRQIWWTEVTGSMGAVEISGVNFKVMLCRLTSKEYMS